MRKVVAAIDGPKTATWQQSVAEAFSPFAQQRVEHETARRNADRQIESLALLDVYGRVARTLLDMAEDDKGIKIIRHKVSRQDMAKVVGASREMVSRVMKDLEERGVIETQENGSVIIKERLQND